MTFSELRALSRALLTTALPDGVNEDRADLLQGLDGEACRRLLLVNLHHVEDWLAMSGDPVEVLERNLRHICVCDEEEG